MKVIYAQTPDHGLRTALTSLLTFGIRSESRNGPVLRFSTPVTTVWENPLSRISTDPARDANPFLHFIEAFWMLSGHNDVATVAKLAANMTNYSDDGVTLNGAYGKRWRSWFRHDQINSIIEELIGNPDSRRCVLQMWDGYSELPYARSGGKDACCNHAISFDPQNGVLNMTVSNRSNDIVWGCYGANVVHMSILHEYIAHQAGMELGTYYQVSSNLHLYLDNPVTKKLVDVNDGRVSVTHQIMPAYPLFDDVDIRDTSFLSIIDTLVSLFGSSTQVIYTNSPYKSIRTLEALMITFDKYKQESARSGYTYLFSCDNIDPNWKGACMSWLARRPSFV